MKRVNCKIPNDNILAHICRYFYYDAKTGSITRTDRKNSNGSLDKDGYLILKIKGNQYKAHRVAWFLYYGTWPTRELDHIDGNRTNNRVHNLREADSKIQTINRIIPANKDTGVIGVYKDKTRGLRKVFATTYNQKIYRFSTLDEAIKFRINYGRKV